MTSDNQSTVSLAGVLAFVRQSVWIIALAVAMFLAGAITYIVNTRPSFVATAQVMIEAQKLQVLLQDAGAVDLTIDNAQVESQVEVLRSERIAAMVIDRMGLIDDREFQPKEVQNELQHRRATVAIFLSRVSVRRIGQSYLLEVSFRSYDAEKAALLANALVEAYMHDQLEAKAATMRQAGTWMQERMAELGSQLHAAVEAVQRFKTENGIVNAGNRGQLIDQQLSEMNSQLVSARSRTAEAKARLDRINDVLSRGASGGAGVAESLNNTVITGLRQRYLDAFGKRIEAQARYGAEHDAVVALDTEMRQYDQAITAELNRIGQTYANDYQVAKGREDSIDASMKQLVREAELRSQAEVNLAELETRAQSYRKLYETMLQRYTETMQKESFPVSSTRMITRATQPLSKSSPRTVLILLFAMVAGGMAGIALALARQVLDRAVRTPQQLRRELGLPCLGVLPRLKSRRDRSRFRTAVDAPFSPFGIAMRHVYAALPTISPRRSPICLGVVSMLPQEGKTTVAMGLAALSTLYGSKALFVDACAPALARSDSAVRSLADDKMSVIEPRFSSAVGCDVLSTGGRLGGGLDHGGDMQRLLRTVRGDYQLVMVDLPDMTTGVEARRIGAQLDGCVIVAEWGRTSVDGLAEMIELLRATGASIVGVVINKGQLRQPKLRLAPMPIAATL